MENSEKIKSEIIENVRRYYDAVHAPGNTNFVPGESFVRYAGRVFDSEEIELLVDSALDFWLTAGKYAKQFEQDLAETLGVRYAILVNSGSSANLLAFSALTSPLLNERQILRGDEIITVAAGFPTTVAPAVQYGAVPVFIDVDLETANIRVDQLEAARSPKTKAVILAHTLGNPFNLDAVTEFCKKHSLWLIEDNCDALGSRYNGKMTGTRGDIGTSSFYPAHHITMGEGGAVYTNNPQLKKILLSIRDWGRDCWCESGKDNTCGIRFSHQQGTLPFGYDHKYIYSHFGYNLKATEMQAAIGVAQLKKLPSFIEKRKLNFQTLYDGLRDLSSYFIFPKAAENSEPAWFGFMLVVRPEAGFTRGEIVEYLETHKIQTRNLFGGNLTRQPIFTRLTEGTDYRIAAPLINTDTIMNDGFWIGVFPGMTDAMIDYMIQTIRAFISGRKQ